eukprot:10977-Heterococcus_DN1.PRE.3
MAKASSSSSSSSGEPPLYVQLMSGKKLKLELSIETTTVLQLKQLIEQSSDVPPERQRLLFSGREIPKERDSKTLAKAGIGANGIRYLHMVARPAAAAAAAKKSSSKATVIDLDPTPARASASSSRPPAGAANVVDLIDSPTSGGGSSAAAAEPTAGAIRRAKRKKVKEAAAQIAAEQAAAATTAGTGGSSAAAAAAAAPATESEDEPSAKLAANMYMRTSCLLCFVRNRKDVSVNELLASDRRQQLLLNLMSRILLYLHSTADGALHLLRDQSSAQGCSVQLQHRCAIVLPLMSLV